MYEGLILPEGVDKDYLPAGIQLVRTRKRWAFTVKFMISGARINLGTFETYQAALEAMKGFKERDKARHQATDKKYSVINHKADTEQLIEEVAVVPVFNADQITAWKDALQWISPALLVKGKPVKLDDGSLIPSMIVDEFIEGMYTDLLTGNTQKEIDSPFGANETINEFGALPVPEHLPSFAELMAAEAAAKEASSLQQVESQDKELP
jgi:hypothetical protein